MINKTQALSAVSLLLALGASGAAQAVTSTDIRYVHTDGITLTTSDTQDGYLTGALQFTNSLGNSFEAYCVELAQGHAPASAGFQTYTPGSFTTVQSALLQGLFSSSYASVQSAEDKAAFQTAIWEIMEEPANGSLNAGTGKFQFWYLSATSSEAEDSAFASQTNAYLLAASSYSGPARYQLNKLDNATYQDYITVSAVPEPESYAMLLAGLLAVGFIARRRRSR